MRRLSVKRAKIGGFFIVAGLFLANETVAWIWNRALDWLRGNWGTLPWFQIIGVVALFAGCMIALWPTPRAAKGPPPPSRTSRLSAIFQQGNALASIISKERRLPYYRQDEARDPDVLAANAASLSLSLAKEGFPALPTPDDLPAYSYLVGVEAYFSTIFPLVRDRHIVEAEQVAADLVQVLQREMRGFNNAGWFLT